MHLLPDKMLRQVCQNLSDQELNQVMKQNWHSYYVCREIQDQRIINTILEQLKAGELIEWSNQLNSRIFLEYSGTQPDGILFYVIQIDPRTEELYTSYPAYIMADRSTYTLNLDDPNFVQIEDILKESDLLTLVKRLRDRSYVHIE